VRSCRFAAKIISLGCQHFAHCLWRDYTGAVLTTVPGRSVDLTLQADHRPHALSGHSRDTGDRDAHGRLRRTICLKLRLQIESKLTHR